MKKNFIVAALSLFLIMTGCSSGSGGNNETPTGTYPDIADGTYEGTGSGFAGDIKVSVKMENGEIVEVAVLEHSESLPGGVEQMPQNIVDNGIEADVISGTTRSSEGIRAAVKDALGLNEEESAVEVVEGKDVVVVGGGNAGLSAAYWACENGATVVLFEKQDNLGGTFGGGTWIATGSNMQLEQGITNDSTEMFMEDIDRLNAGYVERTGVTDYWFNRDLAIYFGDHMAEITNFADDIGVDFGERILSNPTLYEPHNVMRVLSGGNRQSYTDALVNVLKEFEENGQLQIVTGTNVTGLIQEDDGTITGVTYDANGTEKTYASKAVILATGGYGFNEDLVKRAGLVNYTTSAPSIQTGDGYIWAEDAGASLKNMDFITTYAAGIKTSETGLTQTYAIRVKEFGDIIFVNSDGERFIDEFGPGDGSTYDAITYQWKVQKDNYVYIAVSQSQIDAMKEREQSLLTRDTDWTTWDKLVADGEAVFVGSTAEEVAELAGINAEAFAETIEKYNGYVDAGLDEDFGRTNITSVVSSSGETVDLGKDTFTKLEGDIYLVRTTPYIMICAGGIDVNTNGQALDENREPIPGLYAAGEIVGMANAFGRTTIGGIGNTGTYVWGQMAGEGVIEYLETFE